VEANSRLWQENGSPYVWQLLAKSLCTEPYLAGGLGFGAGGSRIPTRNSSPVALRFQTSEMLWFRGCSIVMAPGRLHSRTQVPQYQHSSGYTTIGGRLFSGLGMRTSERQISTQRLHPVHTVGSNSTAWFGAAGFGTMYALRIMLTFLSGSTADRTSSMLNVHRAPIRDRNEDRSSRGSWQHMGPADDSPVVARRPRPRHPTS